MKNLGLSGLLIVCLIALAGCENSTDELNDYIVELTENEVRVGAFDILVTRDVQRDVDLNVEMSFYEKCKAFFDSNPDMVLVKDSLVYEQFLLLALGNEEALLSPFLAMKNTLEIERLGDSGQNLILSNARDKVIADKLLNNHRADPRYREAQAFLQYNSDFPKIKPLGVCMAQEMFISLFGQPTLSTEMLQKLGGQLTSKTEF